jgi:prepilin-type N-terminal cleavage/methylation domain-containing protein
MNNFLFIRNKKAFTFVEILVAVLIVALISTLVMISLSNSRSKGRDLKRINDVNQIQVALENYKNVEGRYPEQLIPEESLVGSSSLVFMNSIPSNQGYSLNSCLYDSYYYENLEGGESYQINFCLENNNNNFDEGLKCAGPNGILNVPCEVKNNLLAYWEFDGNLDDLSGNGFNGLEVNGANFVSGLIGQALEFDGATTTYALMPNLGIASGPFSIVSVVYFYSNPPRIYRTICGYAGTRRLLVSSAGRLLTQFGGNFFSNEYLPNEEWFMISYVWDGVNENWYINDRHDNSDVPTATPSWNNQFYVGQYDLQNYPHKGLVDSLRFYNRALSYEEIIRLYETIR